MNVARVRHHVVLRSRPAQFYFHQVGQFEVEGGLPVDWNEMTRRPPLAHLVLSDAC
jgi:hypothetical protein